MSQYSPIAVPLFDPSDLRDALEKLRQAAPVSDSPLRTLVWVRHRMEESGPTATSAAFEVVLGEAMAELIEDNLARLRQLEGLPSYPVGQREAELEALRCDYAQNNVELEAWSALYYRYVRVDLSLRMQDIAYTLGLDARQVRRRLVHGYYRLTEALSLLERGARIEHRRLWMSAKLPPTADALLFGRSEHLAFLIKTLSDPTLPSVICVVGTGGIGKTTLAHAAAREIIEREIFQDFVWLTLAESTPYRALLDAIARAFGYPHLAEYELSDLEGALRSYLLKTPSLIVLDSADSLQDYPEQLNRLNGLAGAGRLLLTTRQAPPAEVSVQFLPLPPLEYEDIAKLMRHHARLRRIPQTAAGLDDATVDIVYRAIGGNPLAARLVVGQMASLPLERILNNLESLRTAQGVRLFNSLFSPTWQALSTGAHQAAMAFHLLPSEGVGWQELHTVTGLSDDILDRALTELTVASWLDSVGEGPRYMMHPLTLRFVESRASRHPDRALYLDMLLHAADHRMPSESPDVHAGVTHALTAIRAQAEAGDSLEELIHLIEQASPVVRRAGYWATWEELLMKTAQRLRDSNALRGLGIILLEMGAARRRLGQTEDALDNLEEAVALFGQMGEFVRQADALIEVGKLYHTMGQTEIAYEAYQRAAAIARRHKSSMRFRQAVGGLATLALHNERIGEALDLLNQALETLEEDEVPEGLLLSTLGMAHLRANQPEQALRYQLEALAEFQTVGDLPNQARTLLRLGAVYVELCQYDQALKYLLSGLALMRDLGDAFGQARALTNLGTVHHNLHEPAAAIAAWQEALTLQEQLHDQIGLAYTWYNLADLQWSLEEREEAHKAIIRARALAERLNLVALMGRIVAHPAFRASPQT